MPLVEKRNVLPGRIIAIWHVKESEKELFKALSPSIEDESFLQSFKHPNKRLEWLAGRLLLKDLCANLGLNYQGVRKTAHGKPVLQHLDPEISLSHSFPMVAAIIDLNQQQVGIDIEQKRLKVLRLKEKFMTKNEIVEIGPEDFTKATLIWSAKETLYKIYAKKGLVFKEDLEILNFEINDDRNGVLDAQINKGLMKAKYKIGYSITSSYVLTYNI